MALATAWAAPAEAATIRLEVTPSVTIHHAWVGYYHRNSSGILDIPLGILLAGQKSVFQHEFPGVPDDAFQDDRGWLLTGLYGEEGSEGVSLSFINDSPIVNGETWESFVQPISDDIKQNVVQHLRTTQSGPAAFFHSLTFRSLDMTQDFGMTATIINFSEASFGGTALAVVVPEPSTWVLMFGAAGLPLVLRKRR